MEAALSFGNKVQGLGDSELELALWLMVKEV